MKAGDVKDDIFSQHNVSSLSIFRFSIERICIYSVLHQPIDLFPHKFVVFVLNRGFNLFGNLMEFARRLT